MSMRLKRWFKVERDRYGEAGYYFKEHSTISKLIAFYVRPFNPRYLSRYTTTRYPDTYFPGSTGDEESMLTVEFHENVHKWDRWYQGFRFNFKYAYPQIVAVPFILLVGLLSGPWGWLGFGVMLVLLHAGLAALALSAGKGPPDDEVPSTGAKVAFFVSAGAGLVAFVTGTIVGGGLLSLLWLGALLFLSPLPFCARWRRDSEVRGYTATLYQDWLRFGNEERLKDALPRIVRNFTGPAYFYMEPNGQYVEQELRYQISRFTQDERRFRNAWDWKYKPRRSPLSAPAMAVPYHMISEFMRQEGMRHDQQ